MSRASDLLGQLDDMDEGALLDLISPELVNSVRHFFLRKHFKAAFRMYLKLQKKGKARGVAIHTAAGTYGLNDREVEAMIHTAGY